MEICFVFRKEAISVFQEEVLSIVINKETLETCSAEAMDLGFGDWPGGVNTRGVASCNGVVLETWFGFGGTNGGWGLGGAGR